MTKLREHGVGHEAILSLVCQILEEEKESYAGIRMRCVATKKTETWLIEFCLIEGVLLRDNVQKMPSVKYKDVSLLEQWIKPGELTASLETIVQGALVIDGHHFALDPQQRFNECARVPSENNFSHYPGHLFTTSRSTSGSFWESGPLISPGKPFYANHYLAIRDWIRVRDFQLSSDARLGTILMFLPQSKAYFDQVSRDGDELVLSVEGSRVSGLFIKGAWEFLNSIRQVDLLVRGKECRIPWVETSEGLELYLIGQGEEVYDYHRETQFWSISHRRLFGARGLETAASRDVEQLLLKGEGEQAEFKPFIDPEDSSKLQEMVRTAIAFANKNGGAILIGVDNVCEVVGVEKEILTSARKLGQTPEQAFDRYLGKVRQAVASDLNATPEITMEYVSLHNHKVLVIRIAEGDKKPYWHVPSSLIYVRRGANTVKAHPEFDLPKLISPSSTMDHLS